VGQLAKLVAAGLLAVLLVSTIAPALVEALRTSSPLDEPGTARKLLDAISHFDTAALASLEASSVRAGSTDFESAQRVLTAALAGSEIEFLATGWGARDWAPSAGVSIAFQNLTFGPPQRTGNTALIQVRGGFEASSTNALADAALKLGFRRSFVASVPLIASGSGGWLVDTRTTRTTAPQPSARSATAPRALDVPLGLAPNPAGFPSAPSSYVMQRTRVGGSDALILSGCQRDVCFWGGEADAPLSAVHAVATWSGTGPAWGVFMAADTRDPQPFSAYLAGVIATQQDLRVLSLLAQATCCPSWYQHVPPPCVDTTNAACRQELDLRRDRGDVVLTLNGVEVARDRITTAAGGTGFGIAFAKDTTLTLTSLTATRSLTP